MRQAQPSFATIAERGGKCRWEALW